MPIFANFLINQKRSALLERVIAETVVLHLKNDQVTRIEFIEFLKEFRKDLEENKSNWENRTLEDFLEAMEAYTVDVQGFL